MKKVGHQLDKKHTPEDKQKIRENFRAEFAPIENYEPKFAKLLKQFPIEKRY